MDWDPQCPPRAGGFLWVLYTAAWKTAPNFRRGMTGLCRCCAHAHVDLPWPRAGPPWPAVEAMAALGGWWGAMPLNRKRFERALLNVRQAFPTWNDAQVRWCGRASYEHIFRLAGEFLYIPRLINDDNWPNHLEVPIDLRNRPEVGPTRLEADLRAYDGPPALGASRGADIAMPLAESGGAGPALDILLSGRRCVMVTGHCGNWELLAYLIAAVGFPMHAVYRPLDNPALDRWVRSTRERRGITLLDKFGAAQRINNVVEEGNALGFVADQNAGDRGLFVPYFGRLASTYKAIGLLAIKYDAARRPLGVLRMARGLARRGRVPISHGGHGRDRAGSVEGGSADFYVTARYRRALEQMVRKCRNSTSVDAPDAGRVAHAMSGRQAGAQGLDREASTLPWMTEPRGRSGDRGQGAIGGGVCQELRKTRLYARRSPSGDSEPGEE